MANSISFSFKLVSLLCFFFLSKKYVVSSLPFAASRNNDHESICSSHTTCSDCSSSAIYCHWCSSDEACHSTKHWMEYSCVIGADCKSIERCQREEPEKIQIESVGQTKMGVWIGISCFSSIMLIQWIISSRVLSSALITWRDTWKKRYYLKSVHQQVDDLVLEQDNNGREENGGIELSSKTPQQHGEISDDDYNKPNLATGNNGENEKRKKKNQKNNGYHHRLQMYETVNEHDQIPSFNEGMQNPWTFYNLQQIISVWILQCIHSLSCKAWIRIVFIAVTISAIAVSTFIYFPKSPEVNICSTKVGWTEMLKQVENFETAQPSFDVLMSIKNPNKMDITFQLEAGSFNYLGSEFGSFELNSTLSKAQSITDYVITVKFIPSALDLRPLVMVEQMMSGALYFTVDAVVGSSFPGFLGLSFSKKIEGYVIDFGRDFSAILHRNRELCACDF